MGLIELRLRAAAKELLLRLGLDESGLQTELCLLLLHLILSPK